MRILCICPIKRRSHGWYRFSSKLVEFSTNFEVCCAALGVYSAHFTDFYFFFYKIYGSNLKIVIYAIYLTKTHKTNMVLS